MSLDAPVGWGAVVTGDLGGRTRGMVVHGVGTCGLWMWAGMLGTGS